jgi:hypothetical protein
MFGVSPIRVTLKEGTTMDTAKIFLGLALVVFSAALMVTPSNAYGYDTPRDVGNGNVAVAAGIGITTALPLYLHRPDYQRSMLMERALPEISFEGAPYPE